MGIPWAFLSRPSAFVYLGMSQFLAFEQFWQYCILGWQASSFSVLKIDQLTAFWFPRFLTQNLLGYWDPVWGASLLMPSRSLYLSRIWLSLVAVYLTWNLSLLDVCGASFIYLGTFSAIISSNILALLALSLPLLRLPQCICYSSWCFTGHLGSILT